MDNQIPNEDLIHFYGIVNYTLRKYGLNAKFKIVFLDYAKWQELSIKIRSFDYLNAYYDNEIDKQIRLIAQHNDIENDVEIRGILERREKRESIINKEYGHSPTLEENLNSIAIHINDVKNSKKWFRKSASAPNIKRIINRHATCQLLIFTNLAIVKLAKEDINIDCHRELLKTMAHEALHYVEYKLESRSDFESIENESELIVDEYINYVEGKESTILSVI